MRRFLRVAGLTIAVLLIASVSFGAGWIFGTADFAANAAVSEASNDLAVLQSLHRGQIDEALDLIEFELDINSSVAAIAVSDLWLSSDDREHAECVLSKVKKYRETHPSPSSNQEFASTLTELLAREFHCARSAA